MTKENIQARINELKQSYNDVAVRYEELDNGSWIVILRGGLGKDNPTKYMNDVVSHLVKNELYNEFIESYLDNPWIRIIIFGFNEILFV